MPLRLVRVRCESIAHRNEALHFDMPLGADGRLADHALPFCGWWGDLRGSDMDPFVVHVVAGRWRLDLGTLNPEIEHAERYLECDLFGMAVTEGQMFTLTAWGEAHAFRVAAVVDLVGR